MGVEAFKQDKVVEVLIDQDGDVRYDWSLGRGKVLSVYAAKDGKEVGYAFMNGKNTSHGSIKREARTAE